MGLGGKKFKKIAVLTGFDINKKAGIPDFFHKEKYHKDLFEPNQIYDLNFFKEKPHYFYNFAKDYLLPGKF